MASYFPVLGPLSTTSQGSLVPLERRRSRKQVVRVGRCAQPLPLLPGPFGGRSHGTWVYVDDYTTSLGAQSSSPFPFPYFVCLLLIVRTLVPYHIRVRISHFLVLLREQSFRITRVPLPAASCSALRRSSVFLLAVILVFVITALVPKLTVIIHYTFTVCHYTFTVHLLVVVLV